MPVQIERHMTLASIAFLVRGVRELRNRSISISFCISARSIWFEYSLFGILKQSDA